MSENEDRGARRFCGAKKQDETTCRHPAGFRTTHPGFGKCRYHGGTSKNLVIAAAREQMEEIASLATDIDADPHEVLLSSIGRCWGAVHWCGARISQIEDTAAELMLRDDLDLETRMLQEAQLAETMLTFNKMYGEWIDKAAKLSKVAIDAGIDERRIELENEKFQMLARLMRAVFDDKDLNLSVQQRKTADLVFFRELKQAAKAS